MERLTNVGSNGEIFITDNDETRKIGRKEAAYQKLKEYENLEEQGLMKIFPCKVGDTVYYIPSKVNYDLNILNGYKENNRVYHQKIAKIVFTERGWYLECDKDLEYGTDHILLDKFYQKMWFLRQAEAEETLKGMKGEEE